jgi:hypothetical protein
MLSCRNRLDMCRVIAAEYNDSPVGQARGSYMQMKVWLGPYAWPLANALPLDPASTLARFPNLSFVREYLLWLNWSIGVLIHFLEQLIIIFTEWPCALCQSAWPLHLPLTLREPRGHFTNCQRISHALYWGANLSVCDNNGLSTPTMPAYQHTALSLSIAQVC